MIVYLSCIVSLVSFAVSSAVAQAAVQAPPNTLEVVVGNGPFAGTYKPPGSEVVCMHAKAAKSYVSSWKDFSPKGPKAIAEAGLNVSNPDGPGAKQGSALVRFGDSAKKSVLYSIDQAPIELTIKGKTGEIKFAGKTKDGIELRLSAKCLDVEQL